MAKGGTEVRRARSRSRGRPPLPPSPPSPLGVEAGPNRGAPTRTRGASQLPPLPPAPPLGWELRVLGASVGGERHMHGLRRPPEVFG